VKTKNEKIIVLDCLSGIAAVISMTDVVFYNVHGGSAFKTEAKTMNIHENRLKQHETIGCCGIDCGLCPRYHTLGTSACPGCGGENFKEKHPSCGFLTCCAVKHGFEACSFCSEFPCKRFDAEKQGFDSFVTHRNVFTNLATIKHEGMECFITQQKTRIALLKEFLAHFDDGRSKSFFCLSCALLPIEALTKAHSAAQAFITSQDVKMKNRLLREHLTTAAQKHAIDLKLHTKK